MKRRRRCMTWLAGRIIEEAGVSAIPMVCRGPVLCFVGSKAYTSKGVATHGVCLQGAPLYTLITGDLYVLDHTRVDT